MAATELAIIGGGWRTEFFMRVAQALPEQFRVSGVLVRNVEKAQRFAQTWNVPTHQSLDELLRSRPSFVVVSVPWPVAPQLLRELAERGMPALCETPPAPDLDELAALQTLAQQGARIQVAEQYIFQPLHAARLALVRSGKLGAVTQAQVSAAHGYHGISLMRHFLGVQCEPATITAMQISDPLIAGPDRNGLPSEERLTSAKQTIAWFEFDGKLGVFDFNDAQYFSWVRSQRLLVRGERGEINNQDVRYLLDFSTPIHLELMRHDTGQNGNLEGYYHVGITAGAECLYRNPFAPARLSDDEIAIATCMANMASYVEGGPNFYSLELAAQDHYLNLMMQQAVATRQPVRTAHVWQKQ
jgi:predicted dehydrogenase